MIAVIIARWLEMLQNPLYIDYQLDAPIIIYS